MKALIIIPCYNEEKRLPEKDFADFMEQHREISFLFVNDGSTDNTGEILKKLSSKFTNADMLELEKNCGKAEAVRRGMLHAAKSKVQFIGFFDADLATPLSELPGMLDCAEESTLYISGCRIMRLGSNIKRKFLRHIAGRIFATAASILLDLPVYDTQCGAKLYTAETVNRIFSRKFVTKWFFDVEILRRMIRIYGREQVISNAVEYPLHHWIDKDGSKIKIFVVLSDFISLLLSKD